MSKPNPIMARILLTVSLLLAVAGIAVAFAPYGYGFVTVFLAAFGVMAAGTASAMGASTWGPRASRANMVGVLVYVLYMVSWMPTDYADHSFDVNVIEVGVLADQSVFSEEAQAAGEIHGIRMTAQPCGEEWIIRVTGQANSHLGVYMPDEETRECLNTITTGGTVLRLRSEIRSLTGVTKGYQVLGLDRCDFDTTDGAAVVKARACEGWF
jgi:hypothetical protein